MPNKHEGPLDERFALERQAEFYRREKKRSQELIDAPDASRKTRDAAYKNIVEMDQGLAETEDDISLIAEDLPNPKKLN